MKNNLDERQENQLLNIEKNGCWFAFWALLASIFIQQGIFGISDFRAVAGEWIVFMTLAIYLIISCLKKGIWDRHLKADSKTNLITSIIAAFAASAVFSVINYMNYKKWQGAVATFAVMSIFIFVLCFAAISVSAAIYKKRVKKLEEEVTEE